MYLKFTESCVVVNFLKRRFYLIILTLYVLFTSVDILLDSLDKIFIFKKNYEQVELSKIYYLMAITRLTRVFMDLFLVSSEYSSRIFVGSL